MASKGMQVVVALGAIAAVLVVISIIATVVKWLLIIAVVLGIVAAVQFVRERRS